MFQCCEMLKKITFYEILLLPHIEKIVAIWILILQNIVKPTLFVLFGNMIVWKNIIFHFKFRDFLMHSNVQESSLLECFDTCRRKWHYGNIKAWKYWRKESSLLPVKHFYVSKKMMKKCCIYIIHIIIMINNL